MCFICNPIGSLSWLKLLGLPQGGGGSCTARALRATFTLNLRPKEPQTHPFQTHSKLCHPDYPSSRQLQATFPSYKGKNGKSHEWFEEARWHDWTIAWLSMVLDARRAIVRGVAHSKGQRAKRDNGTSIAHCSGFRVSSHLNSSTSKAFNHAAMHFYSRRCTAPESSGSMMQHSGVRMSMTQHPQGPAHHWLNGQIARWLNGLTANGMQLEIYHAS